MPRPYCQKTIASYHNYKLFKPHGIPLCELEEIILTLDELEALRLSDLEGLYQEAAARAMDVSRQTFGRIIESARKKTAAAIIEGKALRITQGNVRIREKGDEIMKIAIPTVGDQIDQHFGHCEKYSIFTIEDAKVIAEDTIESSVSCGCKSGIASTLAQNGIKILIAGGIGDGAVKVLASNGIQTIKGATGTARQAVELYLKDELVDNGELCHSHGADHECSH